MATILLVEDDLSFGKLLETFLIKKRHKVAFASTLAQAKSLMKNATFDMVLSDMRLPDCNDLEIIPTVLSKCTIPIIMISGYAEVNLAVKAIQLGAIDYLEKPIQPSLLLAVIDKALNTTTNEKKILEKSSKKYSKSKAPFIKGISKTSKKLHQHIELVAPTNMSVLVIGKSGTGKENIAKTIHNLSNRSQKPFVAVDCGAIPKEIASSEFFGHIKGSFTGALHDKEGHFSAANGGTLFLDEIGNLSYELQIQLLRAIQERKIRPIGSSREIEVNIRIVAATNSNLDLEAENGNFREDLLHRLNEFSIHVPSLINRKEDLLIFINYFIDKANDQLKKNCAGISYEAHNYLKSYHWPGNLRELQNVIKRAVLFCPTNELIIAEQLPSFITAPQPIENIIPLQNSSSEITKIEYALKTTKGNKAKAARLLKVDRKTLYNKLKKYNLNL